VYLVIFPTGYVAWILSKFNPVLRWGWSDGNVIFSPLVDGPLSPDSQTASSAPSTSAPASGQPSGGGTIPPEVIAFLGVGLTIMIVAMVIFVYHEERVFRDSHTHIVVWAFMHMLMGIQLFAVFPLYLAGLLLKEIHDRKGLETAYVAHLGFNCSLVAFVTVSVLWLVL
jgi:hypothetical protein